MDVAGANVSQLLVVLTNLKASDPKGYRQLRDALRAAVKVKRRSMRVSHDEH